MLEAMKSLLGGSVGSYAPQQPQPHTGSSKQQRQDQENPNKVNPAVEINLSAQARRIMEAMERGELQIDDQDKVQRNDNSQSSYSVASSEQSSNEVLEGPFDALEEIVEELINSTEDGILTDEELAKIEQLFGEISATLEATQSETVETVQTDLTPYEQLKAIILFSELNRLLGNVGVFFGRDLSLAKMSATAQDGAEQMFGELTNTLGVEPAAQMNTNQEARVDAIFRELEQLYSSARNNMSNSQSRRLIAAFEGVGSANNAALG